jgi:hypothetical protein
MVMGVVEFDAVVGQDQVIRPPHGITLPRGEVKVTVRASPVDSSDGCLASTRGWLLALAKEAEEAAPSLPSDMAEHHDRYAHGKRTS